MCSTTGFVPEDDILGIVVVVLQFRLISITITGYTVEMPSRFPYLRSEDE